MWEMGDGTDAVSAHDTLIAGFGRLQFEMNFHHTDDIQAAAETTIPFRSVVT